PAPRLRGEKNTKGGKQNMKKSKGMQIGALLMAMLLLSMAFVPAVSAKADDGSNKQLSVQKKQVAEALEVLKSAQTNGEIGTLSAASDLKYAVDALRVIVSTVQAYDNDPRLDQASSELVTASNLLAQEDIEGAVPHIVSALDYLWDYVYDKGSQLAGWLYNALVDALNYLYNLIVPYL
ncbi:MAG: hypothetical protein SCH70_13525, partial [Candidatus Methanoperedens sp.]|nr:hypothetical protein [Candidatus Methanoperedens sp.]